MASEKKVLIVDDSEEILEVLKTQLLDSDYRCFTAQNSKDAKKILDSFSVDMIISDIKMPHESGISLLKWVKESSPNIPVLLMTGFSELLNTYNKTQTDESHILTKPFTKDELLYEIQLAMDKNNKKPIDDQFCPLAICDLISEENINHPIYIRLSAYKYVKIANNGSEYDPTKLTGFESKGLTELYLTVEDYKAYAEATFRAAVRISTSNKTNNKVKAQFLMHTGHVISGKILISDIDEKLFKQSSSYIEMALSVITENEDVFSILEFINSTNQDLYTHQLAVSIYSVMLAKQLGWEASKTLNLLAIGGLFHDVGKKTISRDILLKNECDLSEEEEFLIKSHPLEGAKIVNDLKQFEQSIVQIILQHHENCAGTGYPFQLKQNQISQFAKLVGLIDLFCKYALKTSYIEPLSPKDAVKQIESFHLTEVDEEMFIALKKLCR